VSATDMMHARLSDPPSRSNLLALCLLASCAAGERLAEYPERAIDRPFTLPEGVAAWHSTWGFSVEARERGDHFQPGIPWPLAWSVALTDDLELDLPFPGLEWQLFRDELLTIGLSTNIGWGLSSVHGFLIAPGAGAGARLLLGDDLSLEVGFGASVQFGTEYLRFDAWHIGASSSLGVQLGDRVFARAGVDVDRSSFERAVLRSDGLDFRTLYRTDLGPFVSLGWLFARQWEAGAGASYDRSVRGEELRLFNVSVRLTHFW
jgi:hypothetical protein